MFIGLIMAIFTSFAASLQLLLSGNLVAGASLIGSGTVMGAGTMYLYQKSADKKKKKKEDTVCDEVLHQIDCC